MTISSNSLRGRFRRLGFGGMVLACAVCLSAQGQAPKEPADAGAVGGQQPVSSPYASGSGDLGQSGGPGGGTWAGFGVNTADQGGLGATSAGGQSRLASQTGLYGSNDRGFGGTKALSGEQIFAILREEPDALVEVKSLVAELAQRQGLPIQADAITDAMLDEKIAASAALRGEITSFLRARGFVSEDGRESDGGENGDLPGEQLSVQSSDAGLAVSRMRGLAEQSAGARAAGSPDGDFARNAGGLNGYESDAERASSSRLGAAEQTRRNRLAETSRDAAPRNITSPPQVLRQPAPENLLSLRDLYTQLPEQSGQLKRFGSDVFLRRNASGSNQIAPGGRETPLDVPAGPGYVVGPGDGLSIVLWGGVSQTFTREIDREGRVSLPESGAVQVAGLPLERVQALIADTLRQQYRNVQVAVTVAHLRSIRVYVVGDVQRPGAYDIGSLSTSLNALYAAGGPTAVGSLRILRHFRGSMLVGETDLYDFLLHGVQSEDRLEAGDTVLVPPAGAQVAVSGAVKRPAIYEMKGKETLAAVLDDAGGATVAADLGQIEIDRIDANQRRETVSLALPGVADSGAGGKESARAAIADFPVNDGDRVRVSSILPYSQRVVYMQGHVVRPGRVAYRDGMRLGDVLRSYRDLLPEPADRGEIVRLVAPDLHPETIEFNLPEALIGNENLALEPFDTIRIHGRYEADAPRVTVGGEVLRPGTYALSAGMTAAQLVRAAGGFRRDALLDTADLTSYNISGGGAGGSRVVSASSSVRIGEAVAHPEGGGDVPLKPGDVLTVHQIAGWNDIGASITIDGEVAHPGNYGIQQGERLSSILRRAGGFRETGYPAGAVLLRDEVRRLEEKSRQELIRQLETSTTAANMKPTLTAGDQSATLQLVAQQQDQVLARLKSQPATGRMVIHIGNDIASWENTPDDIEVRAGDVLRIPKRPGFVLVSGQVYNTSAITYAPDKTAGWYLRRAGGATEIANKSEIFIIRANGSVVGRGSGSFLDHDVLATRLDPGDVVVVPQKILGASVVWRNLLTVAQIASSVALTAAVAGVL